MDKTEMKHPNAQSLLLEHDVAPMQVSQEFLDMLRGREETQADKRAQSISNPIIGPSKHDYHIEDIRFKSLQLAAGIPMFQLPGDMPHTLIKRHKDHIRNWADVIGHYLLTGEWK